MEKFPWKANLLVALLVCAVLSQLRANPLDEAAAAYEASDFKKAAAAYTAALDAEPPCAALYYNLGLAHKRAAEPGHAALALRRALMLDPRLGEARIALSDLERSQGIVRAAEGWRDWIPQHLPLFPALLSTFVLFWLAIALSFFAPRTMQKILLGLFAALCIAAFLAMVFSEPRFAWRNDAVVLHATTLSKIPADRSETVAKLAPATLFTISSESGAWVFGKLKDTREGWVPREAIERIAPRACEH